MKFAIYDFAASPASYNILDFLAGAKAFAGAEPLHVVLVPGLEKGFKTDRKPITVDEKRWRVTHIVLPAIRACGATFTVCPDRKMAERFPYDYPVGASLQKPVRAHLLSETVAKGPIEFRPSAHARKIADDWLKARGFGEKPLVTITLRETYIPERNSNLTAWLLLTQKRKEFTYVWVRDTAQMTEQPMIDDCVLAALDLDVRLALYDAAVLNCGIAHGPLTACWYSQRYPYLTFHPVFPDKGEAGFTPTAVYMAAMGLPVGSQFRWATPRQKIVWEKDDLSAVLREFDAMTAPERAAA